MDAIKALLHLDGYGWYVWPSYAICTAVWAVIIIKSILDRKHIEKKLAGLSSED